MNKQAATHKSKELQLFYYNKLDRKCLKTVCEVQQMKKVSNC